MKQVTTSCSFDFRGCGELERPHSMEGRQHKLQLECAGPDVIGQFFSRHYQNFNVFFI
jgi:hypothetical protein